MRTRNKIIITVASMCLAAAVIVVGVLAFTTQTFSISNSIGFLAGNNVEADVVISSNKNATSIDLNGNEEGNNIEFSYSGEEIVDGERNITIPSQTFSKRGDYVETIIEITNNGDYEFSANLDEATLVGGKPNTLDVTTTYTLDNVASENGATVTTNSVFVITIRVTLNSQLTSVNWTYTAIVTLGEASEQPQPQPVSVPAATFAFGATEKALPIVSDLADLLTTPSDFSYVLSAEDLQNGEIGTGSVMTLALSRSAVSDQISNGNLEFSIDLPEGWAVSDGTNTLNEENLSLAISTDKVSFYLVNSTENLTYTCNIYLIDNLANFKVKIESGDNYSEVVTMYRSSAGDYFTLEQSLGYLGEEEGEQEQTYQYLTLGVNIDSEEFYTVNGGAYSASIRVTQGPNVDDVYNFETESDDIAVQANSVTTRNVLIDTTNSLVEGVGVTAWLNQQAYDFVDLGFTDYALLLAGSGNNPMELSEGDVAKFDFGDGEVKTVVFDSSLQDFFGLETNCSYLVGAEALQTGTTSSATVNIAVNVADVDVTGGSIDFAANIADGWSLMVAGNYAADQAHVSLSLQNNDYVEFSLVNNTSNYTLTCYVYLYDENDAIVGLSSQGRTITLYRSADNDNFFTAESTYMYFSGENALAICANVELSFFQQNNNQEFYIPLTVTPGINMTSVLDDVWGSGAHSIDSQNATSYNAVWDTGAAGLSACGITADVVGLADGYIDLGYLPLGMLFQE